MQGLKRLNFVESIFNDSGLGYIFASSQTSDNFEHCKVLLNQILQDQFIQKWFSDYQNSSRGQFYSSFKIIFCLEKYLIKLPENNRIWLTKLRTVQT